MHVQKWLAEMVMKKKLGMWYLALILAKSLVWSPLEMPRQENSGKTRPEVDAIEPDSEDSGDETASLSPLSLLLETLMGIFPSLSRSKGTRGERYALGLGKPDGKSSDP